MTIYSKIIFTLLITLSYSLSYIYAQKNSVKAIQKLLISIYFILLLSAIFFPDKIVSMTATFLGASSGTDSILSIFIVLSISINFMLVRKIRELDNRLRRLIQQIALKELKKD